MTYIKTNWNTGDTITAEKMNHIENGIAEVSDGSGSGSILPITRTFYPSSDDDEYAWVLDKTYGEILSAINSGKNAIIVSEITKDDAGNVISENRTVATYVYDVRIMPHLKDENSVVVRLIVGDGGECINGVDDPFFNSIEDALNSFPDYHQLSLLPIPDDDGGSGTISPL